MIVGHYREILAIGARISREIFTPLAVLG